jgi:hypothetical protein
LIFTALYRAYGSTVRLSIYLTIALVLTLIALWSAGETSDRSPAARSHPPVT